MAQKLCIIQSCGQGYKGGKMCVTREKLVGSVFKLQNKYGGKLPRQSRGDSYELKRTGEVCSRRSLVSGKIINSSGMEHLKVMDKIILDHF